MSCSTHENFIKPFIKIVGLFLLVISRTKLLALHSRCTLLTLELLMVKGKTAKELHKKLGTILKGEDIEFDPKVLAS